MTRPRPRVLLAALALSAAASASLASDDSKPNHVDLGIVPYMINTHYGGAKAEVRVNLAPGAETAGLYLSGSLGAGSWSDRIGPFIPWFSSDPNYSKWKTKQKLNSDLGLAVTYKTTAVAGGLMWVDYDSAVHKHRDGVDYFADSKTNPNDTTGTKIGGWIQWGIEVPIDRWLAGIALGYRETRDPINVQVASGTGKLEHVEVRPVRGVYLTASLRFKII